MEDDDGTQSPAPKRPRSQKRKEKAKVVSPNEGILEMLSEIEENAKGHLATSIRRAKKNIAACPLPIRSGEDAGRIKFVGDWLQSRIAAYLAKHPVDETGTAAPSKPAAAPASSAPPEPDAQVCKKKDNYEPRYRSGPYAILLGLLTAEGDGHSYLNKLDLGAMAEPYADDPIHDKRGVSKNKKFAYNGWSSVGRTLIPKGLVLKAKSPAQYSLTEKGRALAIRLRDNLGAEANIVTTFSPNATRTAPAASATNGDSPPPVTKAKGRKAPARSRKKKMEVASAIEKNAPTVSSAPSGSSTAAIDPAQVMLLTQVVAGLQSEGHPAQKCNDALKAVLENGNIPSSEPALRVLILHKISCSEGSSSAKKSGAGGGRPVASAQGLSKGPVVIDSGEESETMDLVDLSKPQSTPAAAAAGSTTNKDTVILVLDSREKLGQGKRQTCSDFAAKIRAVNVSVDVRTLPVGDAVFVRRCAATGRDTMLDFVVERKAAADFASSVADGRILRQSFSMQNSSFARRLFVIEGNLDTLDVTEAERDHLDMMTARLSMHYGFYVKHTRNTVETVAFYESICRRLRKDLAGPVGDAETFSAWHDRMSRFNTSITQGQLFQLQLAQIPGINAEQAKSVFDAGITDVLEARKALSGLSEKEGRSFLKNELKRRGEVAISTLASKHFFEVFSTKTKYDTEFA